MDVPVMVNVSGERWETVLPYVSVLGVTSVVGTLGNLLVMAAILLMARSSPSHPGASTHGVGNIFIFNLALADIIVTAIIIPFSIIGALRGMWLFPSGSGVCGMLASMSVISCVVSILSIGSITVNRYIYICHHASYNKIFTRNRSITICACLWLIAGAIDLPTHVGWSHPTFDLKSHKCIWDRNHRYSYTAFFSICGVMMPLMFIVIFYLKIFLHMNAARRKLDQFMNQASQKVFLKTLKQARMIFTIFVVFSLCWSPYTFVLLLDKYDHWSMEVHLYTSMMAHIHASVNFIIYAVSSKAFRKGYKTILCGPYSCLRKQEVPSSTMIPDGASSSGYMDDIRATFLSNVDDVNKSCVPRCCRSREHHVSCDQDDVLSEQGDIALSGSSTNQVMDTALPGPIEKDNNNISCLPNGIENGNVREPDEARQSLV